MIKLNFKNYLKHNTIDPDNNSIRMKYIFRKIYISN